MAESDQNVDILLKLKSAVLNIDWEISDDTLDELGQEITWLQSEWAGQKVQLIYLQILGALCQYIAASRENSHPGTFLLLKEAFDGLESVVLNPDIDPAEKNKDVMAYAERYNNLKKEIASGDFTPGPTQEVDDEKSTMDTLMDDDEDHSTDTVFDSMLNAMVKTPAGAEEGEDGDDEEAEATPEPTPVATPPARPAVQASFNKADGTEVEPDRNETDEFSEADDLLDDFFDDDDIPAPGASEPATDDEIFDLNELQNDEGDEGDEGETILDLSIDSDEAESPDAEDSELVIELDAEPEDSEDEDSFQEMEDTLDDFFGDDDDEDLLDPVDEKDDDALIDEALDDFFDDDEDEGTVTSEVAEDDEQAASATSEDDPLVMEDPDELTLEETSDDLENTDDADDEEIETSDDPLDIETTVPEDELKLADATDDGLEQEVVVDDEHEDDLLMDDATSAAEISVEIDEPESVDPEPALVISPDDTATEYVVDDTDVDESLDETEDASCVENLQMLLLSVEWEVDDKLLLRLGEEVDSLKGLLHDNNSASIHLNFLGTVIHYISREQADIISDSMACLKLIADSLEQLMLGQGDIAQCDVNAVRSFVDWHELVVLDFEKRLEKVPEEPKSEEVLVSTDEISPLSDEMQEMKESILKEVRELIAKALAESQG